MDPTTVTRIENRRWATLTRAHGTERFSVHVGSGEGCDRWCVSRGHGLAHLRDELDAGAIIRVSDVDLEGNCLTVGYLHTMTLTPDLEPVGAPGDDGDTDDDEAEFDDDGFFDHRRGRGSDPHQHHDDERRDIDGDSRHEEDMLTRDASPRPICRQVSATADRIGATSPPRRDPSATTTRRGLTARDRSAVQCTAPE